jgi:uncharacterized protein YbaP (TraB family)
MKTKLALFILLTFVSFASQAQLLYKIQGKDLQKPSYIYGTIHIMPKKQFAISESITTALKECDALVMEVDINMDLKTQIDAAQRSLLPDGKTIADITSAENAQKIRQFCIDSLHWKESKYVRMSRLTPFFLSSIILQDLIGKSKSFEVELNKLAEKNKMTTLGLETIQMQMNLVNDVPYEEQIKLLLEGLTTNNSEYNTMLNCYLKQDLNKLGELMNNAELSPEFNANFLVKRNQNWIPQISKMVQDKPIFIAVGAGHLPGEQGVLKLLQEAGYTVSPIN